MTFRTFAAAFISFYIVTTFVTAEEVNVYSYRQPHLIEPLTSAFTAETGIAVNVAFLKKGLIERLRAEGSRSPADLVFTVDISRLNAVVEAGLTQSLNSEAINLNIPSDFRDPNGHWFGLTTRARIVYASKDRVSPADITTYEDLANPKWKGRICTRSGTHPYTLALTAAHLYHHSEPETLAWLQAVKDNLARKPQGNDRAQIKAIWSGECDIALGNTYYMAYHSKSANYSHTFCNTFFATSVYGNEVLWMLSCYVNYICTNMPESFSVNRISKCYNISLRFYI